MALSFQSTADRFAKSTQHLLSHYKKSINSFTKEQKDDTTDADLTDEEIAIRCNINFQRLLQKTLSLVQSPSALLPNPHLPPLRLRVEQQFKSLEADYEELVGFQRNKKVKNVNFDSMPQHQLQMDIIREWIVEQEQQRNASEDERKGAEELREKEAMRMGAERGSRKKKKYEHHWKLRNRKRTLRFSERLTKENEEKQQREQDGMKRKGAPSEGIVEMESSGQVDSSARKVFSGQQT